MDRLAFRATVNGTAFYDKVMSADITHTFNAMSTCSIVVPNDDNKYNSSSLFAPGSTLEFEASKDGGASYTTLFSGTIRNLEFALSASGLHTMNISAQGGYYFSGIFVSPNQVVFRQCDIGHVFVGQKNDINGEPWNPDENGNYPDGLLYKTGYKYLPGSVWSLYPTVVAYTEPRPDAILDPPDLPGYFTFNAQKIFEVMNYFADTYGLMFFFDHKNKTCACYQDSTLTEFPPSSFKLVAGENISQRTFTKSDEDVYDSILMIGSTEDIFYIYGDGQYEQVFIDQNIKEVDMAIDGAEHRYDIHNNDKISGEVVTVPVSDDIFGKRIEIDGGYMSQYGNVVSVTHRIREDRWETSIKLESERRTVPKLLSEIMDKIENKDKLQERGQVYIKCFAETSTVLK